MRLAKLFMIAAGLCAVFAAGCATESPSVDELTSSAETSTLDCDASFPCGTFLVEDSEQ